MDKCTALEMAGTLMGLISGFLGGPGTNCYNLGRFGKVFCSIA